MAEEILRKWARKSTSWQESIPSRVCQRMSYKQTKNHEGARHRRKPLGRRSEGSEP